MTVKVFRKGVPQDFKKATELPSSQATRDKWQHMNRQWWEQNPMRYDFTENLPYEEFTEDYYFEIDRRFHQSVNTFMPWTRIPFDPYIDYDSLSKKDVLEIGVGCGSNAQLLATRSKSFTGIDLTDFAVNATSRRFKLFDLPGKILQMDAEKMEFDNDSFDFIWSWGVIHHSSNTNTILKEMHRVLRPGGIAITMVYHTSVWNTYVRGALYYGILKGGFLRTKSLNRIIQESTDGALARYYTIQEWEDFVSGLFAVEKVGVYGSKSQLIPLSYSRFKQSIMDCLPDSVGRYVTNRPSMGFLLVTSMIKR